MDELLKHALEGDKLGRNWWEVDKQKSLMGKIQSDENLKQIWPKGISDTGYSKEDILDIATNYPKPPPKIDAQIGFPLERPPYLHRTLPSHSRDAPVRGSTPSNSAGRGTGGGRQASQN